VLVIPEVSVAGTVVAGQPVVVLFVIFSQRGARIIKFVEKK
jgi:hypothetical protein